MNPACQNFRRALAPALDHELPPAQQLEFDAHRGACPDCAHFLRVEAAFNEFLRENLAAGPLPDMVDAGIQRTLRGARRAELMRTAGTGVAALFLVGLVSYGSVRLIDRSAAVAPFAAASAPGFSALTVASHPPAPATLRGQLVCVQCLLSERYHIKSNCQNEGHRGALLLSDGTLIYFMDGTDEKLRRPDGTGDLLEHEVEVEGDYAPGEKYVKVRNYHLVNS